MYIFLFSLLRIETRNWKGAVGRNSVFVVKEATKEDNTIFNKRQGDSRGTEKKGELET